MNASREDSPLDELRELVASLTAYAQWQEVTGATGLPAAPPEMGEERGALELPKGARAVAPQQTPAQRPSVAPPAAPVTDHPRQRRLDSTLVARPPQSEPEPPPERPTRPVLRAAAATPDVAPLPATPLAGGPSEDATRRLEVLATEVKSCTRCSLHAARTQTVFSRGKGSSGLCFVGEGPGADEDAQGYPFVGAAGQLLDKMITAMGFDRDEVYVCNIVKCRPPKNRKPEPDEMKACAPFLTEQLDLVDPQAIVALGATAVQGLLGTTGGITRLRGNWRLYRGRIAVMPTFHPAYLLRQPSAKKLVWQDLQEVLKHLGRPVPSR